MNFQTIITPVLGVILVAAGWRAYGWGGVVAVVGVLVMWALLHVTRITRVLGRAADAPLGYVASAVMLNAKLKPGVNLLHVLAMTRSLGERLSAVDADPEIFRWTDGGASSVTAEFTKGKLVNWTLMRPSESPADAPAPSAGT